MLERRESGVSMYNGDGVCMHRCVANVIGNSMNALLVPSFFMLAGVLCLVGFAHLILTGPPRTIPGAARDFQQSELGLWRLKLAMLGIGTAAAFTAAALLWT